MVGDSIAEEGIDSLRALHRDRRRIGRGLRGACGSRGRPDREKCVGTPGTEH